MVPPLIPNLGSRRSWRTCQGYTRNRLVLAYLRIKLDTSLSGSRGKEIKEGVHFEDIGGWLGERTLVQLIFTP